MIVYLSFYLIDLSFYLFPYKQFFPSLNCSPVTTLCQNTEVYETAPTSQFAKKQGENFDLLLYSGRI